MPTRRWPLFLVLPLMSLGCDGKDDSGGAAGGDGGGDGGGTRAPWGRAARGLTARRAGDDDVR